jgi:hypothetical protein
MKIVFGGALHGKGMLCRARQHSKQETLNGWAKALRHETQFPEHSLIGLFSKQPLMLLERTLRRMKMGGQISAGFSTALGFHRPVSPQPRPASGAYLFSEQHRGTDPRMAAGLDAAGNRRHYPGVLMAAL